MSSHGHIGDGLDSEPGATAEQPTARSGRDSISAQTDDEGWDAASAPGAGDAGSVPARFDDDGSEYGAAPDDVDNTRDLRAAVGADVGSGGGDSDETRASSRSSGPVLSRRAVVALVLLGVFLIAVAVLWFLGNRNSSKLYIDCGDEQITASRGRAFPPWGTSGLSGKKWAAVDHIVEFTQCDDETFSDMDTLEARYRSLILRQIDTWLESIDKDESRADLPTVRQQLEQAALLSRPSDVDSIEARKHIARLSGDVSYWEAIGALESVTQRMRATIDLYREAVERQPVHARDAKEWLEFIQHLDRELTLGPPILRPAKPAAKPSAVTADKPQQPSPTQREPAHANPDVPRAGPDDSPAAPVEPPAVPNPPPPASGTLL